MPDKLVMIGARAVCDGRGSTLQLPEIAAENGCNRQIGSNHEEASNAALDRKQHSRRALFMLSSSTSK